jgi:hypothetical protein
MKAIVENKEEVQAFIQLKGIIMNKLQDGEIDWAKEKIVQICQMWDRRDVSYVLISSFVSNHLLFLSLECAS